MIYPVEDDSDDFEDVAEPEPSWADSPMLPRGDMLAVIQQHKDLDGRAVNLFKNALEREPRSDLLRHYVGPNLYHPGSHYIYTTPDPRLSRVDSCRSRPRHDWLRCATPYQSLLTLRF
jgi:hypothetical protein